MTHRGSWGPGSGMPYALCMYFALFSIFSAGNGHLNGTNSFIKKHYLVVYTPIHKVALEGCVSCPLGCNNPGVSSCSLLERLYLYIHFYEIFL